MNISAKYFRDRTVLALLAANLLLTLGTTIFMILQLSARRTDDYIVQCRDCSNISFVGRFLHGGISELLAFIIFALLVLAVHSILSMRTYTIHRQLSVTILGLGLLLLILSTVVSNALLVLR